MARTRYALTVVRDYVESYNANYGQVGGGVASQPFYQLYGITAQKTVVQLFESMNFKRKRKGP